MTAERTEFFESWTLIKESGDLDQLNPTPDSSDTDGISVISDNEVCNQINHSDSDQEKTTEQSVNTGRYDFTPPATPKRQAILEDKLSNIRERHSESDNHPLKPLLPCNGWLITVIIIFYGLCCAYHEKRFHALEHENMQLKERLRWLEDKIKIIDILEKKSPEAGGTIICSNDDSNSIVPETQDVWMGAGDDSVTKVINKKRNSLPDYCYQTLDEDDLFFEYNQKSCHQKSQQLDNKIKNGRDETYEDFIDRTTDGIVQSFADEIQNIKNKRTVGGKNSKKWQRKEIFENNEWITNRIKGRETMRQNSRNNDPKNWYLKRKDEREIQRLQS